MWVTFSELLPWFFTAIFVNVLFDLRAIAKHVLIPHNAHALAEGVALTLFVVGYALMHPGTDLASGISCLFMYPAVRWLVHDLSLNIARNKPISYRGIDGQRDSITDLLIDRFVSRVWHYFAIKFGFLAASALLAHSVYPIISSI